MAVSMAAAASGTTVGVYSGLKKAEICVLNSVVSKSLFGLRKISSSNRIVCNRRKYLPVSRVSARLAEFRRVLNV
ncbi:hypothetical protein ACHQM5_003182 [Ranunculus cassubicifolius]